MFTVKLYSADGFRQIIKEAESFTILRPRDEVHGSAEITLHQKGGESSRYDVKDDVTGEIGAPPRFAKAIIENSAGRTTEIVQITHLVNVGVIGKQAMGASNAV